jgi:hypothetical protein
MGFNTPSQDVDMLTSFFEKVGWMHKLMMARRVMLGVIVSKVFRARPPIDEKLLLADAVFDPIEEHFCLMVLLAKPAAVELSVCRGVAGC